MEALIFAILWYLCVVCQHFCCPMSLFQGHVAGWNFSQHRTSLKGLVHDNAHARSFSLQNKFVGSTLNSKSPLPVQSLKILRFIRTSVALAGLVILRLW